MALWSGARIEADTILPVQFFARSGPLTPQLKLRAAVLENAFHDLNRQAVVTDGRYYRLQAEVREWFESDDRDWPFSFVNLCDDLGLDPKAVRGRLSTVRAPFYLDLNGPGQQRAVVADRRMIANDKRFRMVIGSRPGERCRRTAPR